MNIWHDIGADRIKVDDFIAVIETPKGSKKKYEKDKDTGLIILDRVLHTSAQYPTNYGFIPRTLSEDGDPLDVLVMCSESIEPMTLVRCYPIGIIDMIDSGMRDEKIIAVPMGDPYYNHYKDIKDMPPHVSKEIEHFLSVYKALEKKSQIEVKKTKGRDAAEKVIVEALERYSKEFGKN